MSKCERDHARLKRDTVEWLTLEPAGFQPTTDDDGRPMLVEQRNCSCGSTLGREIHASPRDYFVCLCQVACAHARGGNMRAAACAIEQASRLIDDSDEVSASDVHHLVHARTVYRCAS